MKKKNTKMKALHLAEAVFLTVGLIFLVVYGAYLYKQRKDSEALIAAREPMETSESFLFKSDKVTRNGKTYKRNTYVKAILCMGVDRSGSMEEKKTTGSGGQADGIFLVAQDTARNTLKILMIPRDTMTKITLTDLSGNVLGKDTQHLTLAYAYGDGREKSCEYMAEAVSDLMGGLAIDHYLAADTDVIAIVNDLVGGVTVTVPSEGMEKADPSFIKGNQVTLHGKQAEKFVRYRDITEDHSALYRMNRQQEYMEQFFAAAQKESRKNSNFVSDVFDSITQYMVTDMEKAEYLKMAMDALESGTLDGDSIYTLPGQGVTTPKYDEFYPDKEKLQDIVLELFYREE